MTYVGLVQCCKTVGEKNSLVSTYYRIKTEFQLYLIF